MNLHSASSKLSTVHYFCETGTHMHMVHMVHVCTSCAERVREQLPPSADSTLSSINVCTRMF